tara:strand:+ start:774 stop:2078 length:1305 start_codon:yes stop_codon:yes gene_type:complete
MTKQKKTHNKLFLLLLTIGAFALLNLESKKNKKHNEFLVAQNEQKIEDYARHNKMTVAHNDGNLQIAEEEQKIVTTNNKTPEAVAEKEKEAIQREINYGQAQIDMLCQDVGNKYTKVKAEPNRAQQFSRLSKVSGTPSETKVSGKLSETIHNLEYDCTTNECRPTNKFCFKPMPLGRDDDAPTRKFLTLKSQQLSKVDKNSNNYDKDRVIFVLPDRVGYYVIKDILTDCNLLKTGCVTNKERVDSMISTENSMLEENKHFESYPTNFEWLDVTDEVEKLGYITGGKFRSRGGFFERGSAQLKTEIDAGMKQNPMTMNARDSEFNLSKFLFLANKPGVLKNATYGKYRLFHIHPVVHASLQVLDTRVNGFSERRLVKTFEENKPEALPKKLMYIQTNKKFEYVEKPVPMIDLKVSKTFNQFEQSLVEMQGLFRST